MQDNVDLLKLEEVGRRIYERTVWVRSGLDIDTKPPNQRDREILRSDLKLWEEFRDALGVSPGTKRIDMSATQLRLVY